MGLLITGDIETINGNFYDSFYVRIENIRYSRPMYIIGVAVAHYTSKEDADKLFPKRLNTEMDASGQLATSMSYNDTWEEWNMYYEFPLTQSVEVVQDIFEKQWVTSSIEYTDFDENGDSFVGTHDTYEEIDVKIGEETVFETQLNTLPIESNMFEYVYQSIKTEYINKCGTDNVSDEN